MRPPSDFHDPSGYARPQQAWQCGLGDEGPPCAWGPDPRGGCPALAACRPTRDGDRWICNRAELRGGPCTPGPGPDGACPVVSRCTPVRALRTRRGRWAGACLAAAVGAACLALSGPWRNELIVPGPLSAHHAHLVVGDAAGARCARCHAAAGETIGAWLGWRTSAESRPSQASLCMQCHESSFSPEWAETAHNWPPRAAASLGADDLVANASESRRRDPHASIACAACHREHQGRDHQLAAVGDAECQACHRQRFASFAGDHPELRDWPYARQPNLAFDHALHEPRRDPENRTFACVDCHEPDSAGHRQRTLPYEQACATCHDQALQTSLAQGLPLVALPSVDVAALASSAPALGPWPQAADGDFDGVLPAAATLLMLRDPETAAAVRTLRTPVDLFNVDVDEPAQLAAAARAVNALRELVVDLAARGQPALAERLQWLLGRPVSPQEVRQLAAGLTPDAVGAYRDRWFGATSAPISEPDDPQSRLPAGGWFRDDATLSLRYRSAGHADPWQRAWLDVLAKAASGPHADVAEPLLHAALSPTAPGQCGSCHTARRTPDGRWSIAWLASTGAPPARPQTHFSHRVHTLQSQLRDCTACHRTIPAAGSHATAADARPASAQFEPMSKASCAACHTAGAAGEACTQCHRYHTRVKGTAGELP